MIAAGPAALLVPDRAASAFGIPVEQREARAYLLAAAARDSALGVALLAAVRAASRRTVIVTTVFAVAFVAAADASNVAAYVGWTGASALLLHVGGLVALVVLGGVLWRTTVA